jgi:hypothetical protein
MDETIQIRVLAFILCWLLRISVRKIEGLYQ